MLKSFSIVYEGQKISCVPYLGSNIFQSVKAATIEGIFHLMQGGLLGLPWKPHSALLRISGQNIWVPNCVTLKGITIFIGDQKQIDNEYSTPSSTIPT